MGNDLAIAFAKGQVQFSAKGTLNVATLLELLVKPAFSPAKIFIYVHC